MEHGIDHFLTGGTYRYVFFRKKYVTWVMKIFFSKKMIFELPGLAVSSSSYDIVVVAIYM